MKIKFNHKTQEDKDVSLRPEYEVLVYGEFNDEYEIYVFANEQLSICEYDQRSIIVTENNLESYVEANHLNYGRKLLIKKALLKYCSNFENYGDLKTNHIWNKSKTARYFVSNQYQIPDYFQNTVLSESYKMNLIEGYLMNLNNFIGIRNQTDYWEDIYFNKTDEEYGFLEKRFRKDMKVENFEIEKYKQIIPNFLNETIYLKEPNEKEIQPMVISLFKLIDSIFMYKIESIKRVKTFYDDAIEIEYGGNYYSINKIWGS